MRTSCAHFLRSPLALGIAVTLATGTTLTAYAADSSDFTVATATISAGGLSPQNVVSNPTGGFVVAWNNSFTIGLAQTYVQAFTANATPIGSPFAIGDSNGTGASLAASKNGDYVASWLQTVSGTQHIFLQRFGTDGTPEGTQVDVGTIPAAIPPAGKKSVRTIIPTGPLVAMDDDGDAAVVWETSNTTGFDCNYICLAFSVSEKVYGTVYAADNSIKKATKALYSLPFGFFTSFSGKIYSDDLEGLAMDGAGDIVIALDHYADSSTDNTALIRCTLDLNQASPLQVIPDSGHFRGLGIDNAGNVTVGWVSVLYSQMTIDRFDTTGNILSNTVYNLPGSQYTLADVVTSSNGAFAVEQIAYSNIDFFGDGDPWPSDQFQLQYFNADGSLNGAPVILTNDSADLNQVVLNGTDYGDTSAVNLDANGNAIIVWQALLPDQVTAALLGSQTPSP